MGAFGFLYLDQNKDKAKADAGYPAGIRARNSLMLLGGVNFLGLLFTFLVPESKGKSLEEMSGEDGGGIPNTADQSQGYSNRTAPVPEAVELGKFSESEQYQNVKQQGICNNSPMAFELTENRQAIHLASPVTRRMKALTHFRFKLEDMIQRNCLFGQPKPSTPSSKDIMLWGVPLLPSRGHAGTDTVLLKFLEASGYSVPEAFEMLRETLQWRRMYRIDAMGNEQLRCNAEKFVYIDGADKEGRPVWFNTYGANLKDRESYQRQFGSSERRAEFLRCIVQSLETGIGKLSFKEGGVNSLVHVADMTNMGNPKMKELKGILWTTLVICRHRYPEIICKHIMINVPLWFYVFHKLLTRFMPQPNKGRFILARPSRATQTLLKYINPEDLPRHYGGLKRESDVEFSELDKTTGLVVGAKSTKRIIIHFGEAGATVVWDLVVVGWGVSYKEEFIPEDECSYKVLIRKTKKLQEGVRGSFYINEPGEIVITVKNRSLRKKRVLYRTKLKPTVPMYLLLNS